MKWVVVVFCLMIYGWISGCHSHAIFKEPPSRASIGKFKPQCRLPQNHDHMSLYCGGIAVQHNSVNDGRCGICGDPFSGAHPHQAGGMYATGTIGRSYRPGQVVDIEIDLVANHLGFFTFAICPHNDQFSSPNRNCFMKHPLKINGVDQYKATSGTGIKKMRIKLPDGMTCSQCILQYTYTNGNGWGWGGQSAEVVSSDCVAPGAQGKLGCGDQETFRGCADICIGDFCPTDQNTCMKVSEVKMSDRPPQTTRRPSWTTQRPSWTTRSPTTKRPTWTTKQPSWTTKTPTWTTKTPTRTTKTPTWTTKQPSWTTGRPSWTTKAPTGPDYRCQLAGARSQYYSVSGNWYCQNICYNHMKSICHAGANTALICYCLKYSARENPEYSDLFNYQPMTVEVFERENITDVLKKDPNQDKVVNVVIERGEDIPVQATGPLLIEGENLEPDTFLNNEIDTVPIVIRREEDIPNFFLESETQGDKDLVFGPIEVGGRGDIIENFQYNEIDTQNDIDLVLGPRVVVGGEDIPENFIDNEIDTQGDIDLLTGPRIV